jgi:hypothetical protein
MSPLKKILVFGQGFFHVIREENEIKKEIQRDGLAKFLEKNKVKNYTKDKCCSVTD